MNEKPVSDEEGLYCTGQERYDSILILYNLSDGRIKQEQEPDLELQMQLSRFEAVVYLAWRNGHVQYINRSLLCLPWRPADHLTILSDKTYRE